MGKMQMDDGKVDLVVIYNCLVSEIIVQFAVCFGSLVHTVIMVITLRKVFNAEIH